MSDEPKSPTPDRRNEILDAEFLRDTPGLRPFSVGVLALCRRLGFYTPVAEGEKAAPLTSEEQRARNIVIAYLLDERHSIAQIKTLPDLRDRDLGEFACLMEEYEFALAPDFLFRVQIEMGRVERAVTAAAFTVEPKPGTTQGPSPQGK